VEIKHSKLCRTEIRPVVDHSYYELYWVCVKNCKVDNAKL